MGVCGAVFMISFKNGVPDAIRTHDPWLRRPILYPAELRAQGGKITPPLTRGEIGEANKGDFIVVHIIKSPSQLR
jgi:hypothetical protein